MRILALFFLFASMTMAQCPANPTVQLCNATVETNTGAGCPGSCSNLMTTVHAIQGTNPVPPPSGINSIINDSSFSASGVRILRVTGIGFDNRSAAATNRTYSLGGDVHYMNSSVDDSTFQLADDTGVTYVMALNTATFQSSKIPCSFDATTGNIGQKGNCRAITGDGSGQKYLILNTGTSPVSNINGADHPYSHSTPNLFYASEQTDASGPAIYSFDISPTIANQATPMTATLIFNPWTANCFPGGVSTGYLGLSLKMDLTDTNIAEVVGSGSGNGAYTFRYNTGTTNCYSYNPSTFIWYANGVSQGSLVFYQQDGVTAWGASPGSPGLIHSMDISGDGNYLYITAPTSWDNDGTHCNAACNFTWQIGTSKVITPLRTDGHGNLGYTRFEKFRVPSGNQFMIESFPYSAPSAANLTVLASAQFGSDTNNWADEHVDSNTFTSAGTQYTCGVSFAPGPFTTPGATETIIYPIENEAFCYNQAGSFWHVAHAHTGGLSSQNFGGAEGYSNMSRSGKYLFFGSEWDGLLLDYTGATCTVWANCRTDVFVVEMIGPSTGSSTGQQLSGGIKLSGGVTIQ